MEISREPVEYLVREVPLTMRRRARWSECDPGGAVHVTCYLSYVMAAVDALFDTLKGAEKKQDERTAFWTPVKSVTLEFHAPVEAGAWFGMDILVAGLGRSSCALVVNAISDQGRSLFGAALTLMCVPATGGASIEIPAVLRGRLEQYIDRCKQAGRSADAARAPIHHSLKEH